MIVNEHAEIVADHNRILLEPGDAIEIRQGKETINEAAVHRKYLLVQHHSMEDRCFTPSSANDNYVLYFLERLCNSGRFNNGSYKVKVVKKIPNGCKKMSLETFLKEIIPIPSRER